MRAKSFGDYFKMLRTKKGLSLRQFCLKYGLDSSNISKIERGVARPPQDDKLHEYARYLGLRKDTDDWYAFCDLAAAERGKFPKDLMSDKKIRERMPAFFRALRKGEKAGEIAKNLKKAIKEAWTE
jgi:transcriptional regulator with XRE-family HTH domain